MSISYLDHPTEEALERFLLHHSQEDELDRVETHILSCESCVSRLEELEIHLAAVKLALRQICREKQSEAIREQHFRDWFSFRKLSWAGAFAALLLVITVIPHFVARTGPAMDVSLSATRGLSVVTVPHDRPLHFRLSAPDIPNGALRSVIVEKDGSPIWEGGTTAHNEQVDLTVPKLREPGSHYLRLYAVGRDNAQGDLLREFVFEVK